MKILTPTKTYLLKMKMNYRLIRKGRREGETLRSAAALLLFVLLMALLHFFYPRALREATYRVAAPVWRAERFARETATRLFSHLSSKETLIRENEGLRRTLSEQEHLLFDRTLLAEENRALKETLGRRGNEVRMLAALLATPPRSPYDSVVLDAGSEEGIAAGDEVLAGSVVLGRVVTVFSRTAIAELFSTAGVKTSVLILHKGRGVPAEAEGVGGGAFTAVLPKELTISEGDPVVMPGLNPTLFALVETIESGVSDSFQTMYFKNPVSVSELRFLEVRKGAGARGTF